jgi:Ni/Fe-hydrogenase subunit HybB-like protein
MDFSKFRNLISILINQIITEKGSIRIVLKNLDLKFKEKPGTFLQVFFHLLATKQILMNLDLPIDLNEELENLNVNIQNLYPKEIYGSYC